MDWIELGVHVVHHVHLVVALHYGHARRDKVGHHNAEREAVLAWVGWPFLEILHHSFQPDYLVLLVQRYDQAVVHIWVVADKTNVLPPVESHCQVSYRK